MTNEITDHIEKLITDKFTELAINGVEIEDTITFHKEAHVKFYVNFPVNCKPGVALSYIYSIQTVLLIDILNVSRSIETEVTALVTFIKSITEAKT